MTAKPVTPLVEMDAAEVIAGNGFAGQDILSVSQFNRENMSYIFDKAQAMRAMVERDGMSDLLRGNVLTCLFYEPSTRTSASFIAAMERLGGSVIPITQGVQFSSVSKGETLADTVRTLEQYSDAIVLRHPDIGAAKVAADYASCAGYQRGRRRGRASDPGAAGPLHHPPGAGAHRRPEDRDGGRPALRPHRALADQAADAVRRQRCASCRRRSCACRWWS